MFCFKCSAVKGGEGASASQPARMSHRELIPVDWEVRLTARRLGFDTTRKWRYGASGENQVATYYTDDGATALAQKVRTPDKKFYWLGASDAVGLYGKWLWPKGGRKVIVTEGELDALTVSELQENKWPVVSLPHGAASAVKAIKRDMDWLISFEEIVLAFDMDEPGQTAAKACAEVLPLGKVKIAKLPAKDASEAWTTGKVKELSLALWQAEPFRLDGIVTAAEIASSILVPPQMGSPWKWESLTQLTYGRRSGELIGFGGATGGGKTDFFCEQIEYDVCTLGVPTGLLFLEQPPKETIRRIMGKHLSKMLHIPGAGWSEDDLKEAAAQAAKLPLFLFDHFGQMDWETIKARIIYMVKALGCKHIYLDHLTALSAGAEDENKELGRIMSEIAGLAQEMGFIFHFISHLATPEGKPHEEGGRVTMRHFRGSRAIGFWTHTAFGLERNQQGEDEDTRLTTTLRCLKCREYGLAMGQLRYFKYEKDTGRSLETDKAPPQTPNTEGMRSYGGRDGRPAPNDY